MLFRWLEEAFGATAKATGSELEAAVRSHLGGTDPETVRIVVAVAGLLGTVAYADRDYSAPEETRIRAELSRIEGLASAGADAVCDVLRRHIVTIATVEAPLFARELRELANRELRVAVLDALVNLAAADGELALAETNLLRATTTALGLLQDDYNAAQARHRDKLGVLR